jgi:ERCC4-type nuclease
LLYVMNDIGTRDRTTREHRRAYDEFAPLLSAYHVPHEKTSDLEYGDFFFLGNGPQGDGTLEVGIERKTLSDMLTSNREERFSGRQLLGLLEVYAVPVLIVEGVYRADPRTGILQVPSGGGQWRDLRLGTTTFMHSELDRFLLSVAIMTAYQVGKPLIVTQTASKDATARKIADLYHLYTHKSWDEHRAHDGVHMPTINEPVMLRKRTRAEENFLTKRMVAMALKCGVGQDKSKDAAAHFGSIREMINADEKEWKRVPGIGKTIARAVVEEVTYGTESGNTK